MPRKRSATEVLEAVLDVPTDDESSMDEDNFHEYEKLAEAMDVVEDTEADGIILPPDRVDSISDGEDIDEDDLQPSSLPSEVPGTVALVIHNPVEEDENVVAKRKKNKSKSVQPRWRNMNYETEIENTAAVAGLAEAHPELVDKSPIELFRLLYNDIVTELIKTESVRYARQKSNMSFNLDDADLDIFIAIMLLTGYHSLPREGLYWNRDEDVHVPLVSSYMPRSRFSDIKKYLHLADNDKAVATDKLYKVSPLLTAMNKNFQQFGTFAKHLSVDEEMVPYYGHHSCKMYIKGKPIRFGYKLWVLATDSGYPLNVQVCCGKSSRAQEGDEGTGLGYRVVTELLRCVSEPTCHEIYFDNFFTSYDLLVKLRDMNFRAAGTVRENRLKKCPLMEKSIMTKKAMGFYDVKCDGKVLAVKWKDNQCVTIATNFGTVDPVGRAKRWSVSHRAFVDVPQPAIFARYNQHMGGVDLLDRFMSDYRPMIRSKKWWWPLFNNCINMAMVAAWRIHVTLGGSFDHLHFRRYIVRTLLRCSDRRRELQCGPGTKPNDDIRYDRFGHHLASNQKQGRCRLCKKTARLLCMKCNVYLHLHCEKEYHEKH